METILLGAAAGLGAVLLLVGFFNRRERQEVDPGIGVERRQRGEPLTWAYTTASTSSVDALRELGLHAIGDGTEGIARMEGGSQLKTRLLGGYFVKPSDLPITVMVGPSSEAGARQSVVVRDRLGRIGLRDGALTERYAMRAEEIRQAVDGVEARWPPLR